MEYLSELEASVFFNNLTVELQTYLIGRGGQYSISATDLIRKIPKNLLDNPDDIMTFLRSKDISHIHATSEGGSPNDFYNWIFEDPSVNRSRGADFMENHEIFEAELDNNIDAYFIDLETPDAVLENAPDIEDLFTVTSSDSFESTSNILESNLEGAFGATISTGYVVTRLAKQAMNYLEGIDLKEFRHNSKYRNRVINEAIHDFASGGWEEAAKAIVMGIFIATFPPLRLIFIGQGLASLMALGFRWLSTKKIFPGKVGLAFARIADSLDLIAGFFRKLMKFAERIVDSLVETIIKIAKNIGKKIKEIAIKIYEWLMNFFFPENKNLILDNRILLLSD